MFSKIKFFVLPLLVLSFMVGCNDQSSDLSPGSDETPQSRDDQSPELTQYQGWVAYNKTTTRNLSSGEPSRTNDVTALYLVTFNVVPDSDQDWLLYDEVRVFYHENEDRYGSNPCDSSQRMITYTYQGDASIYAQPNMTNPDQLLTDSESAHAWIGRSSENDSLYGLMLPSYSGALQEGSDQFLGSWTNVVAEQEIIEVEQSDGTTEEIVQCNVVDNVDNSAPVNVSMPDIGRIDEPGVGCNASNDSEIFDPSHCQYSTNSYGVMNHQFIDTYVDEQQGITVSTHVGWFLAPTNCEDYACRSQATDPYFLEYALNSNFIDYFPNADGIRIILQSLTNNDQS